MIALEILNEINEQINKSKVYGYAVEVQYNKAYQTRVEKAIKELEELTNRKRLTRRVCTICKTLY